MKKEQQQSQSQSTLGNPEKKILNTKEAAAYLGIDYCNFRKQRNKGYFGRDRYPAPAFIDTGYSEQGFHYRVEVLDKWIENFPSYTIPALHFKATADFDPKAKPEEISDER